MSYAQAAAAGRGPSRPRQQGRQALPAALHPLRHLSHLQGHAFLIDFRAVKPTSTGAERADFVMQQLKIANEEVCDFYVDHITLSQLVAVRSPDVAAAAVAALRAGVAWPAAGGALVYGSAASDAISSVRISNVPSSFPPAHVLAHMAQYGTILSHSRGRGSEFRDCNNGVIHLTMILHPASLPHYIQVTDHLGHLSNSFPVHTDRSTRCCYYCGRSNHAAPWCRFAGRVADAPSSAWSVLKLPAPAVEQSSLQLQLSSSPVVPQPGGELAASAPPPPVSSSASAQPASTSASQQSTSNKLSSLFSSMADSLFGPSPPPQAEAPPPPKEVPLPPKAAPPPRPRRVAAPSPASTKSRSRSPRLQSASPVRRQEAMDTDGFTLVPERGRRKRKKDDTASAASSGASGGKAPPPKVPLATPAAGRSQLDDLVLDPSQNIETFDSQEQPSLVVEDLPSPPAADPTLLPVDAAVSPCLVAGGPGAPLPPAEGFGDL